MRPLFNLALYRLRLFRVVYLNTVNVEHST